MVYYYTSRNIKMLRNIIIDFDAAEELSPYEYMKMYVEKCPNTLEDSKISWIVETFLSFQKHKQFLKEIVCHISDELAEEDKDYFMIAFNTVTFHLNPSDMPLFYKCLFNLSKPLLNTFAAFLSNNEVLTFISQVAHLYYDTNFITEKIINPLFTWQPYIGEMAHSYAQYVKKTESRKLKLPTVPTQPNVLNRKGKEANLLSVKSSLPVTPPNSLRIKGKKMLTKSDIDQKLKLIHENNQKKSLELLKEVKSKRNHLAQGKSDKYLKTISSLRNEMEGKYQKTIPKLKESYLNDITPPNIKDTTTTVIRMNKRIQMSEKEEVQWLEDLLTNCRNSTKIGELEEYDRQEKERERLLDIKKKHLMGQISYEEAIIAKNKLYDDNKKKYQDFIKEKRSWEDEIEKWKRSEIEKNRKQVEKLSLLELEMLHAKHNVTVKKRQMADKTRKESEELLLQAMKDKQEDLERRIKIIKEIKILALIAKKAKVPKIIDLTESSGLGLLCEMSMAELQERLSIIKIGLKEELENRKKSIKENNLAAKQGLEATKKLITNYLSERSTIRKQKKKSSIKLETSTSKEVNELKKVLEEKRKLRIMITS